MTLIIWNRKIIFIPLVAALIVVVYVLHLCGKDYGSNLQETKKEIEKLQKRISYFERLQKKTSLTEVTSKPIIFFITPTYSRHTQQADLIRLSNTLRHVPNLRWILVEDSESKTELVTNLLKSCGVAYQHLNIITQKSLSKGKDDPRWKKHRGVDQRNHALSWIRENIVMNTNGVVYFGDDDNTYHLDLFNEMRSTKKISMWPVALVGGLRYEGPVCKNGKVVNFFTGWMPSRDFPVDFAAFAVHVSFLFKYMDAFIDPDSPRGTLESSFLKMINISVDDIEARADDCRRILVWHTQTAEPKMKQELKLVKARGKGSDPNIVI